MRLFAWFMHSRSEIKLSETIEHDLIATALALLAAPSRSKCRNFKLAAAMPPTSASL